MFKRSENVAAYTYTNPDSDPLVQTFQVLPTNPRQNWLIQLAEDYQDIMFEAWSEQFHGIYTPEQISQTVSSIGKDSWDKRYSPHNIAQLYRLQAGNQPGSTGPVYVHAEVELGHQLDEVQERFTIGIGKGVHVDGRPRARRFFGRPSYDNQLADVSNVFVRPEISGKGRTLKLQNHGVGSAILRSLLDAFPIEMPTVVYDYPENTKVKSLLTEKLGFIASKDWEVDLFGTKVMQTRYDGPKVGQLTATLQDMQPWVRERIFYEAPK